MLVQPVPNRVVGKPVGTCNVDGTAVAISPGCRTAAVEGIVRSCLKPDSQILSVVVAKSAQNRPIDAGSIQGVPSGKKQFAKIRIHAADDIFLYREAHTCGRSSILPGEIP